jgi:hypothetical protein
MEKIVNMLVNVAPYLIILVILLAMVVSQASGCSIMTPDVFLAGFFQKGIRILG